MLVIGFGLEYKHGGQDNSADNEQAHSLERQVAPLA